MAHLKPIFDDLVQRQQRIGAAEAPQRHALHVLHHEVGRLVVEHGVEHLHHVRVVQPAHQGRLGGEEAALEVRLARIGQQPQRTRLMATSMPRKSSRARKTSLVAPSPSRPTTGYLPICVGRSAAPGGVGL
jgi:hypothetical protein